MRKSSIVGVVGLIIIILSVGVLSVKTSGYKDVSYLVGVNEPQEVTVQGKVIELRVDFANNLVMFALEGDNQVRVLAYYPLDKFQQEYGGPPSHSTVDSKIVISGLYKPIRNGSDYIGEIEIKSILTGCHKAYEAPQVKRS